MINLALKIFFLLSTSNTLQEIYLVHMVTKFRVKLVYFLPMRQHTIISSEYVAKNDKHIF